MKVLMIDNYDSFTFNLVQLLKSLDVDIEVRRNDRFTLDEVAQFDKIMISPGPGKPENAGLVPEVIHRYATSKSMLGICLGHQAIGEYFGAELLNLKEVAHGVSSLIKVTEEHAIFSTIPSAFKAARYHSWHLNKENFPTELTATAFTEDGIIMAFKHNSLPLHGLQFHPESILTKQGQQLISNWINETL